MGLRGLPDGVEVPARKVTAEELKSDIALIYELTVKVASRWSLSLAIGNGAALTALSAKVIDALGSEPDRFDRALLALTFPSMWFFAGGLVLAGISPLLDQHGLEAKLRERKEQLAMLVGHPDAIVEVKIIHPRWWQKSTAWWIEATSALAFIAGLTYPMAVLALRYFQDAGF